MYAADENCELDDEKQWAKANPALGKFRDREDLMAGIRKAKRMPAEEPKVRNLFLNQRVSPTSPLISRAEWMACHGDAAIEDGADVYLALDLSSVNDLTALVMGTIADPCRVVPYFWKPVEWIEEHSKRDFGAGSHRYQEWVRAGQLLTTPGRSIDPESIATFIAELTQRYRVYAMAYDRWRIQDLLREFDRIGLLAFEDESKDINGYQRRGHLDHQTRKQRYPEERDGLRLVPWGQGFRDMGPAINAFEVAVMERKLIH